MFGKYYQDELAYLREMGAAFGLANPSIAGLLSERGADPDVERLLEGFAFLTGRIRERLDQAVPEVIQPLCELLLPHYLRPVPAASIVEFVPQLRALRGRTQIPRSTQLASPPMDGTQCQFRTTAPVDLLPLSLLDAGLDQSSSQMPWLRLSFSVTEQGQPEVLHPSGIRLFIHGELALTSMIFLWLQRHCRKIEVRDLSGARKAVSLPPRALQFPGLMPDDPLFPWPVRALQGYRLLQEYFTLPQKLLFFQVTGLEVARGMVGEKFELAFLFERPPPLPTRLGKENFRLHCAPVVNLFAADADPIRHRISGEEYLLRAAGVDPRHMEVYSVESVHGLKQGESQRLDYKPFFDLSHSGSTGQAFYRTRRSPSPLDDGMDTYLSLGSPTGTPLEDDELTLSMELICTNRSLPTRLQVGDISIATAASPSIAHFRNITPVTRPVRPPLGSELHWRLLSHLALNLQSLAQADALRSLLALYNFQSGADHPTARANQLRGESIREISTSAVRRFLSGAPVRGIRTLMDVSEGGFAGIGDSFLFGAVLDELLASSVTVNSFNELFLRLQPSQLELSWPARSGDQPIL